MKERRRGVYYKATRKKNLKRFVIGCYGDAENPHIASIITKKRCEGRSSLSFSSISHVNCKNKFTIERRGGAQVF